MTISRKSTTNAYFMRFVNYIIAALILVSFSCQPSRKLKLASSLEGSSLQALGLQLTDYLNSKGWEIQIVERSEFLSTQKIDAILNNEVDLAFVQNDQTHTRESNDIRTILPLYPNISYIFYRNIDPPKNLQSLINNRSILISKDDEAFYRSLFSYYGVNMDSVKFTMIEVSESVDEFMAEINTSEDDIFCVFAAIHTPHVKTMIDNNWEIFSLEDIVYTDRGSSVEGFCMNYPRSEPFIVPRHFFGQKPLEPISTIALDELLIVNEDANETLIYDLVKDIYDGKHYLSQKDILFNHITENFDVDALNFPLHDGTVNYLTRDEPSFFERYAEAFGVIFSILVVMVGGLTSLRKIRKERIDKYYRRVMECSNIKDLDAILNEAVSQLQNEKLTADESFTILLNLVEKRRHEIESSPLNS